MKFWYTVCVLETKTDRTKTFPQVRWNGLTHKVSISYQYTYAQCITSRESHSLSSKTSSAQKGSLKWRDQKLSRRSRASRSDILFYSLSIIPLYVITHTKSQSHQKCSDSHSHIRHHRFHREHHYEYQAQRNCRDNTFHGLRCLCIRSRFSTRILQITFPLCSTQSKQSKMLSARWNLDMKTGTKKTPALECKVSFSSFLTIQKKSGGGHGKSYEREIHKMNGSVIDDQPELPISRFTVQK